MVLDQDIRFRFAPHKALSAIHWMLQQTQSLDLHTMLKTCYFADRAQLNAVFQPIFGATYRAMRFGPVPLEIYEMAKSESLWLAEMGADTFPWSLDGYTIRLSGNEQPDMSVFADGEAGSIAKALALSRSMTFTARTALTHGPDWQAARLGRMRYEDMFDDAVRDPAMIDRLRESAPFIRL